MEHTIQDIELSVRGWWKSRRWRYNASLVTSIVVAVMLYWSVTYYAITHSPYVDGPFDETDFLKYFTLFQSFAYLIMLGLANLCYNLGPYIDIRFNKSGSEGFRKRLFNLGFWFSVCLPISISSLILLNYFLFHNIIYEF